MIIGIPKEIKESEHRVGMTPSGVQTLIQNGHDVYVQNSAGQGSGHSDDSGGAGRRMAGRPVPPLALL